MQIPQRVRSWIANKKAKLATALLALGIALVIYIRDYLAESWIDTHVLAFKSWAKHFLDEPTGITLALFLVAVLVLLALALVDTSANGAVLRSLLVWLKGKKPRKLSSDERYELDRIREMWIGDSRQACEAASGAIDSMRRVLERRNQLWAPLLDAVIIRLRQAASAMDASLQSDESRAEIEKRFAEARNAYSQCICWCNRCLLIDKSLVDEDNQSWFKKRDIQHWAVLHRSFASRVETLLKYSGFARFCNHMEDDLGRIHLDGDDSAISRLLD